MQVTTYITYSILKNSGKSYLNRLKKKENFINNIINSNFSLSEVKK